MTNEEFERLKESLRAQLSHTESNDLDPEKAAAAAKAAEESRKLDRDMNRIERALTKLAVTPRKTKRQVEDDRRWNEFEASFEKQQTEIRKISALTNAKIKALAEEMQKRNKRQS